MFNIFSSKAKIGVSIVLAFVVVKVLVESQMFIANSPRIHPLFITKLKNIPKYIAQFPAKQNVTLTKTPANRRKPTAIPRTYATNKFSTSQNQEPTILTKQPSLTSNEPTVALNEEPMTPSGEDSTVVPTDIPDDSSTPTTEFDFKPFAKGVYAAEISPGEFIYKMENGTLYKQVSKTITTNGKKRQIKIYIPYEK